MVAAANITTRKAMNDRIVVIDQRCVELHEAFMQFVPRVFPEANFRRWYELGGWDASYRAFAIFDGNDIVANVSAWRSTLVIDGVQCTGCQLGAVGVLPDLRGRGLQRRLLEFALQQAQPDELIYLFANEEVSDFYPRFGFRYEPQYLFSAEMTVHPQTGLLRRLSVDSPTDRQLMLDLARRCNPATQRFGAVEYGTVLLWHWTQQSGFDAYYHENDAALVFVEQDLGVLRVCDVLASRNIDLRAYLPHLTTESIDCVEFCFTPERYFPSARPEFEYLESLLFVRGGQRLPREPFKFPLLAQT